MHFNVSHCDDGFIGIAVTTTRGPVGIDCEKVDRATSKDVLAIAKRKFHADEYKAIQGKPAKTN